MNEFEPMNEGNGVENVSQEMKFDPLTGKPLTAESGNVKSKGMLKSVIIIGVVAIVLIAVLSVIFSGALFSKSKKVLLATANTFKEEPAIMEAFGGVNDLMKGPYTIGVELEAEGNSITMEYAEKNSDKQISGSIAIESIPEIDFLAGITSSQVKVQIPDLDSRVFVYDYTKEKTGYIAEEMDDEDIELIDEICEMIYEQKAQENYYKDILKVVTDEYNKLEFVNAEKKEFNIDGTEKEYKGYKTSITEENMVNVISGMQDVMNDVYGNIPNMLGEDFDEDFEIMKEDLEGMPAVDISFYIHKNKLVAICLEADGEAVDILFKDGGNDMYNIAVCMYDEPVFEIIGTLEDSVETYAIESLSEQLGLVAYDTKSGDYTIEFEEYSDIYVMKGNISSSSKGATMTLSELKLDDEEYNLDCTYFFNKGADIQKFEGEEFDLGNASIEELSEVIEGIYTSLY